SPQRRRVPRGRGPHRWSTEPNPPPWPCLPCHSLLTGYSDAIITITRGRYIVNTPYSRYNDGKEGSPCPPARTARCLPSWCRRNCLPVLTTTASSTVSALERQPSSGCWNG